jgi:hypothetical protein
MKHKRKLTVKEWFLVVVFFVPIGGFLWGLQVFADFIWWLNKHVQWLNNKYNHGAG